MYMRSGLAKAANIDLIYYWKHAFHQWTGGYIGQHWRHTVLHFQAVQYIGHVVSQPAYNIQQK